MTISATRPVVAVLLGTDHHPFSRLVGWVERLAAEGELGWFVQHGATPLPDGLPGSAMLSAPALRTLLDRAGAVVTHGGPGLIMEAREAGHMPIVVPRAPVLGEHVDNHQQLFTARVAEAGLVTSADGPEQLRAAVGRALREGRRPVGATGVQSAASVRLAGLVDELLEGRRRLVPRPRRVA
ncbi:glycosyltransferase [Nocardioides sp.]|uniref:glycosyltransferase n=1 Tax=Nocardioides sp. TaxID=35761 RepID=UPI002733B65F|nr:glycosyltransferase [Nocardioides sp.]MDP3892410.1 glycosyltransferase [Nocardioides sp.]